ncbi:NifU-like protein involved in Fe-S cluster formation [Sphingobium xanthum]|jgi:NifU-like protein involved in Fe-S cluster formation|uniref:iron-sulfur cluster assembly scaffold protein n=1 Tax=Sphingobium xanthum TaxID=1387165 RepID=UPI001C8BD833|nr:iron-sulfur cluster assembly scaffold protein [Sphingobium xanthum]
MSALYSLDVLRMAASVSEFPPLENADARDERRSPTCGSRMTVTLKLDKDARIAAIGLDAKACALGQAAAAIFAHAAAGQDRAAIETASEGWRAYLAKETDSLPDWPGLDLLATGRDYPARHPSMRLAFEAASAALASAEAKQAHG